MERHLRQVSCPHLGGGAILLSFAVLGISCFAEDPEKLWISEPPPGTPPGCVLPDVDGGSDAGVSVNCPQRSDPNEVVVVHFRNNYVDRTINVSWVNFQCQEESALSGIEPGGQQQTVTYVTHVWHVRDADSGEFLAEVIIESNVSPGWVYEMGP